MAAKKRNKATKKATKKKVAKKKTTKKAATKKATKKKVAKKATTKKTATRKATAKAAPKRAPIAQLGRPNFDSAKKVRNKTQILNAVSDHTGLSKKEVSNVLQSLGELISHDLKKGPSQFNIPGMMKITVVRKPATKARKGVNPFTGEEMMFKAKPARNVVKIRPLKGLKEKV